jgi:hypothetical protein
MSAPTDPVCVTWDRLASRRPLAALLALVVAGTAASALPLRPHDGVEELEGRVPTDIELRPSVEAAFPHESYAPRSTARLVVDNRARGLTLQLFRLGAEHVRTADNITMRGIAVTQPRAVGSSGTRTIRVRIGDWPSGLYFARLRAADGRVGFAPFVVRPRRLGEQRVAIVMPTLTWQAYNLRDEDGDGVGDSWYASWSHRTVRLGRPFLNRGVPYAFRRYDLPFLRWLARTGREVDVLAQSDLEASSSAELDRAYDLIVFPGHHEYVTTREYDVIEGYRDRGGNLAFLSANNFFWQVVRHGNLIERTRQWRHLGRPEAGLIGVQYRANAGSLLTRGAFVLRDVPAASWLFAGTRLAPGSRFGRDWGIEIDHTSANSPPGVQVIAEIPDLFGPGLTAQMTYYETRTGARVFAAGAFTFAGWIGDPVIARVAANLWQQLSQRDAIRQGPR